MANALSIRIKDKSKTAICSEVVALCGTYAVTVEGMSTANGIIVFHDRTFLPNTFPFDPSTKWVAPVAEDGSWYGYCELTNGTGTLELTFQRLVTKLSKTYRYGAIADVEFSVYKNGEGLIGDGTMHVKVTEAYNTSEQSFISFKGDTGAAAGFGTPTAEANTLEYGTPAYAQVTSSGPNTQKLFNFVFGIPRGHKGDKGEVTVLGTNTLPEHSNAQVVDESTTTTEAMLRFKIPMGIMPKPSIGTVTTGQSTESASVSVRNGTIGTEFPILDFKLIRGYSAFDIAVQNGFVGTQAQWLSTLIGGDYLGLQASVAKSNTVVAGEVLMNINQQITIDELEEGFGSLSKIEIITNEFGEKIVVAK